MNFLVNKSAPFQLKTFSGGNIFGGKMQDQILTGLLLAAYCCISVSTGNLLSFKLVFSEYVHRLIPNCKMYVSHPRVAHAEFHTYTSLVSS